MNRLRQMPATCKPFSIGDVTPESPVPINLDPSTFKRGVEVVNPLGALEFMMSAKIPDNVTLPGSGSRISCSNKKVVPV